MRERWVRSVLWAALGAFLLVSWLTYRPAQWPSPVTGRALLHSAHLCGPVGLVATHACVTLLGRPISVLIPIALIVACVAVAGGWERGRRARALLRLTGAAAFGVAVSEAVAEGAGGIAGRGGLELLRALLGRVGSMLLLGATGGALLVRYGGPLARPVWQHAGFVRGRLPGAGSIARAFLLRLRDDVRSLWQDADAPTWNASDDDARIAPAGAKRTAALPSASSPLAATSRPAPPRIVELQRSPAPRVVESQGAVPPTERDEPLVRSRRTDTRYTLPSVDILDAAPDAIPAQAASDEDLLAMSRRLEEKLADFGIGGRVSEVQPGPVITTFEFEPAPGIKVSQVTSRVDDLAMALRAQSIRMVAPIPGKAAIGIEIPNRESIIVTQHEIMHAWREDLRVGALGLALGKTVSGEPFFADLAAMPHLLVAGATGSGKSVCINVILCSLLLRHDPNEVKLLLIDPKMLELNAYRDIPHLLHPVVTDPKEAYKALHWLTVEMERRYRELARASVRNIGGYNKKIVAGELRDDEGRQKEILPYVVVIVDELADLMIQVGREIETPIARLAQMARAVGIHLVLATQRPSVDVITGVIKANFPSRIAFQVSSKVDSRTILDTNGAEALLGRGDMLFLPGGRPAPIRLHGAFVSVEECEQIAAHWRQFGTGSGALDLDAGRSGASGDADGEDELFEQARRIIVASGVGSVSYLQRRLKVGYSRAARIMDQLEEAGIVGPAMGAKAREVLERPEDLPALAE